MSRMNRAAWRLATWTSHFFAVALVATAAQAEQEVADRLGLVPGDERMAVQVVTYAALDGLSPPARDDSFEGGPPPIGYDRAWLATQPDASGDEEWRCLSEALYFEARGESVEGMFAVGEVILNRVENPRYPGTICGVVNEGTGRLHACQFSYSCDGAAETIGNPAAWADVAKVARALIDGAPRTLTDGATHYHTRAVSPSWSRRLEKTNVIGAHLFYRAPVLTASN